MTGGGYRRSCAINNDNARRGREPGIDGVDGHGYTPNERTGGAFRRAASEGTP